VRDDDGSLPREVDQIEDALSGGPLGRRGLAQAVGARYWGPGRFRRALRQAIAHGHVRERRHHFELVEQ
jgi:hypothetical protein